MAEQPPESQQVELEEKIKSALRQVFDPELGMNVVELGLIRKLELYPDRVEITMIMTTPFCPLAPHLLEQVRVQAEKAASRPVRVMLGTEMWNPGMMEGGAGSDWGLF